MYEEKFANLDQLFRSEKAAFDKAISELTPDILNRYLNSQEDTDDIVHYLEENQPKYLVQAMWAEAIQSGADQTDYPEYSYNLFGEIPANFNPHDNLK
jgi:hypothetical protein